jgi:hypothetical protein
MCKVVATPSSEVKGGLLEDMFRVDTAKKRVYAALHCPICIHDQ